MNLILPGPTTKEATDGINEVFGALIGQKMTDKKRIKQLEKQRADLLNEYIETCNRIGVLRRNPK